MSEGITASSSPIQDSFITANPSYYDYFGSSDSEEVSKLGSCFSPDDSQSEPAFFDSNIQHSPTDATRDLSSFDEANLLDWVDKFFEKKRGRAEIPIEDNFSNYANSQQNLLLPSTSKISNPPGEFIDSTDSDSSLLKAPHSSDVRAETDNIELSSELIGIQPNSDVDLRLILKYQLDNERNAILNVKEQFQNQLNLLIKDQKRYKHLLGYSPDISSCSSDDESIPDNILSYQTPISNPQISQHVF
ncbi:hypothetical protein AYI68_g2796 [Smittium mucronatum]|uniref:Uncharacterized protein n=1 Tax=Smittium mucronatum TaxID=133383 RepID=A0A1R0H1R3_9FUNG|nr:hypothetical protein AYI68_g2796 [Smittium mucronatum]